MADFKSKKFVYKNSVKWKGQKRGLLSAIDKSAFEVATPPEFKGHAGIWSPEDLFVVAVNTCIMTTFLYYAEKGRVEFLNYESEAEGVLDRVGNQFMFSTVTVKPRITVKHGVDIEKAYRLIELSEKNCLISNSIKTNVTVFPEIKVESKDE